MTVNYEREIKLRFSTAASARGDILALGAAPLRPRRLQSDTLFDNRGTLSGRQAILRVRTDGERAIVTFKNPAEHPTLKLREEIETEVAHGDRLVAILAELGYVPWFKYEKYREEFSYGDVILAIDETPVGTFVEIEGGEAGIGATARRLGRGPADYVLDSYRTLFERYRLERGLSAPHMLFSLLDTTPQ